MNIVHLNQAPKYIIDILQLLAIKPVHTSYSVSINQWHIQNSTQLYFINFKVHIAIQGTDIQHIHMVKYVFHYLALFNESFILMAKTNGCTEMFQFVCWIYTVEQKFEITHLVYSTG